MNTSTLEKVKSIEIESTKLYGIKVKTLQSLQEIKQVWASRTAETYSPLPPIDSIENSLWRNMKSGKISQWNPSMVSSKKKGLSVIENFFLIDGLSPGEYLRYSLEYLNIKSNALNIKFVFKDGDFTMNVDEKKDALVQVQQLKEIVFDIFEEITIKEKTSNAVAHLDSIDYFPFLEDIINYLAVLPDLDEYSTYICTIPERHRFRELSNKVKDGDWGENCMAIHEIESNQLYRYDFGSLKEYIAASPIKIKYDEYIRRSKAGSVLKAFTQSNLPLPSNKSQAVALAEIPTVNMTRVWEKFLESNERHSASLIKKIHEELVLGIVFVAQENTPDIVTLHLQIGELLKRESLTANVRKFLESLFKSSTCSELEFKMVELVKRQKVAQQ